MYLLDTDTLTHLHAGHPQVIKRLRELADPDIGATIITKIELLRGRFDFALKAATGSDLLRAHALLARTEKLLAQIVIVPLDAAAAEQFDRLRAITALNKMGRADQLIASSVLAQHATLVTRNLRHFRQVPGLRVTNWVD
jgi:tRNA(fMet)-specific endonuclease VapC